MCRYAVSGRPLGPRHEDGEKMAMFNELQLRGFTLWYRWRECRTAAEEPVDLEGAILSQVDYAINVQGSESLITYQPKAIRRRFLTALVRITHT